MKGKEIGGYFELGDVPERSCHGKGIALNSGRNCLRYLIRKLSIRRIMLPYYICDAVIDACVTEKCEVEYYHIDDRLLPVADTRRLEADEYFYAVNYFGQLPESEAERLKNAYGRLIIDNAQDFFRPPMRNCWNLYTCRKYFGVPDGAYLYPYEETPELEQDVSCGRMEHILGRYETNAQEFFGMYQENEELIGNLPVNRMSRLTRRLMSEIDYEAVSESRSRNFNYLNQQLGQYNQLKPAHTAGAFVYPLLLSQGKDLKKELIRRKIFVPTLWPNVLQLPEDFWEYYLADNLVCVPCDQRYDTEDMEYIISLLLPLIGKPNGNKI